MVGRLLGIRQRDHRDAAVGFFTLLLAMAAHGVLEAARDALFLARLEPRYLPWAYLAMAALALVATTFQRRVLSRLPRRLVLSLTLTIGGMVTATFSLASSLSGSAWTLMVFYVWTGLLATLVVVQFWLLAGDVMDLGQAKRAFALLGSGGLLGATLGSAAASGVLLFLPARSLPLLAAALLCSSAFLPVFFSRHRVRRGAQVTLEKSGSTRLNVLARDPYLRRVLVLVLLGTITVTGVDYVFKATVAREIAPEHLGDFFARYYTLLNGLALVVQILIAPRLLRSAGIHRTLLLMPLLMFAAATGFALIGGLAVVLLMKGADGALRHSVNRVGTEILYLPLSNDLRERFKGFIEAVGQRGGQAVASVLILAMLALGGNVAVVAWSVVIAGLLWLAGTVGLEPLYVQLFKTQLKAGSIDSHVGVPELDLRSLEALLSALSSEDDVEVVAALDMFIAYEKANLIPALIFYHPSRAVVLRALELFSTSPRPDVLRVAARLLRHGDQDVRAAALRLLVANELDPRMLEQPGRDESPAVRATALVGLVHAGALPENEATRALEQIVTGSSTEARFALAQGAHLLPAEGFAWVAVKLAERDDPEENCLGAAVAKALASAPHVLHIPALLVLLADRDAMHEARRALVALGEPALDALERALEAEHTPRALRRHLPRTISRFQSRRSAAILERFLEHETDEAVGFKILRGLGRMRADDPKLPIDRDRIERLARHNVERAVTVSHYRQFVEVARAQLPQARTHAAELLSAALGDHRERALERAFRLMHILEPTEELEIVYDALRSSDPEMRARGRELLEHVAPASLKDGVLALVDDVPHSERLRAALRFHEPPGSRELLELSTELELEPSLPREAGLSSLSFGYAALLSELMADPSRVLSAIAGYHFAEIEQSASEVRGRERSRLRLGRERMAVHAHS